MFSKKATKIDEIFIVDLTLCNKCQIDDEDFVNFCGLLRKHELYNSFLGGLGRDQVYVANLALPKHPINQFKQLQQNRQQSLRAYYPNIYILCL